MPPAKRQMAMQMFAARAPASSTRAASDAALPAAGGAVESNASELADSGALVRGKAFSLQRQDEQLARHSRARALTEVADAPPAWAPGSPSRRLSGTSGQLHALSREGEEEVRHSNLPPRPHSPTQ